jgi:hypothetical protein
VLIAVDAEIPSSAVDIPTTSEIISVQLVGPIYKMFIVCYYRPPNVNDLDQLHDFLYQLKEVDPSAFIILVGDFNAPGIIWSDPAQSSQSLINTTLLNTLSEFNLNQLITEPTHIMGNTLDLLCTDLGGYMYEHSIISPGLSDHYFISASFASPHSLCATQTTSCYRVYSKANLELYHDTLTSLNDTIQQSINNGNSINTVWNSFKSGLFNALDKAVPTKVTKPRPPTNHTGLIV